MFACAFILLSVSIHLVQSTTPKIDNHYNAYDLKLAWELFTTGLDTVKKYVKSVDAVDKFVLKAPGKLDYIFLTYDVGVSTKAYFYDENLSDVEFCKELIGAGTAFGGSVVGASIGSHVGAMITPGVGTFVGGSIGGNIGYKIGWKVGNETIGYFICPIIVSDGD